MQHVSVIHPLTLSRFKVYSGGASEIYESDHYDTLFPSSLLLTPVELLKNTHPADAKMYAGMLVVQFLCNCFGQCIVRV